MTSFEIDLPITLSPVASLAQYSLHDGIPCMTDQPSRFFLQAIDPDHGCPVLEAMFQVDDVSKLSALMAAAGIEDFKPRGCYDIAAHGLLAIEKEFNVAFEPGDRQVRIESWHSIRATPYLVHTGYELMLLLDGTKKFARMSEEYPPTRHYDEPYFEKHVAAGVLHKEAILKPFAKQFKGRNGIIVDGIREVYYTTKGEEWRISAWKLIAEAAAKTGWNAYFERLEGMLFGYQEWQMDWWIERYKTPLPIHSSSESGRMG